MKEIVVQAWEKWKLERESAQARPSENLTFGQRLIKKLNIKIPATTESFKFAIWFVASNQSNIKRIKVEDVENIVEQKEALDLLVQQIMKMYKEITTLITPHLNTLSKKRRRFLIKDEYGFMDQTKWLKELDYFIDRAIIPNLKETIAIVVAHTARFRFGSAIVYQNLSNTIDDFPDIIEDIKEHINEVLDDYAEEIIDQDIDISLLDPIEYEHFCADLLKENGWNVQVTQASGDQGIDILAEKDGFLLALQCKKYSSPVGNKAVQEAHSGGTFYEANAFAVVSPVEYTSSARELANSLNVHLFHHDDLATLTITDKEKEC